jgi:hypothetical protein
VIPVRPQRYGWDLKDENSYFFSLMQWVFNEQLFDRN